MTDLDDSLTTDWEEGRLGMGETVRVAKGASARLDAATAMRMVSMRLPGKLVDALKDIADHHGIAYQAMVRDLLGRFVESELKQVLRERIAQIEAMQTESTPPVESFMEDTRKAASG